MRFVLVAWLSASGGLLASDPAFARRPYYSQIEQIRLADGGTGEVRLLHGDGILFTDPVRPLIVDAKGRLLARGPKAHSIVISCSEDRHCLIVDLWNERVYDPEPGAFRDGPVQPAVKEGDRTDDWDLEGGDESWGFTMREATAGERLTANLVQARQSILGVAMMAVLAAIGALTLVPVRLDHRSRRARLFARIILTVIGSVIFLFLTALTLFFSMLNGLGFAVWLVPTVLGAGTVWLTAGLAKWRARRAPQA